MLQLTQFVLFTYSLSNFFISEYEDIFIEFFYHGEIDIKSIQKMNIMKESVQREINIF